MESQGSKKVHLRQIVQTVRSNMDSLALCLRTWTGNILKYG